MLGIRLNLLGGGGPFLVMMFMNQNGSVCISVFTGAGYSAEPLGGGRPGLSMMSMKQNDSVQSVDLCVYRCWVLG